MIHVPTCYLCGGVGREAGIVRLPGSCRDDATIFPLKCMQCGLVFLSTFSPACEENYYEDSRMHDDNVHLDSKVIDDVVEADVARRLSLLKNRGVRGHFLDFGCGDGRILDGLRPMCSRVCGVEPERRMQHYLYQKNIDVYSRTNDIPEQHFFDCISLFHVLEHLPDPLSELHMLVSHMQPGSKMIIEVPNADDALLTRYKVDAFMNFTYWSCHLYLFTTATLRMLLEKM